MGRILILEDDARRREAMQIALIAARLPEPTFALTAATMVNAVRRHENEIVLLSLDHDLEPPANANTEGAAVSRGDKSDPGTGRDVADYLATRPPISPIIVHSTNHPAAIGMEAVLTEAGWRVERVAPYGDLAWVDECWIPLVRRLIPGELAD